MKTRRDFLAALGLGAGMLGLPAVAHAWGRRCRLATPCVSAECACQQPMVHAAGMATTCTCACPVALVTQVWTPQGWLYTYYCKCCDAGDGYLNAQSYNPYSTGFPSCRSSQCIGSGCDKYSPSPIAYTEDQTVYHGFLFDPKAKDPSGKDPLWIYKNGITKSLADLQKEIGKPTAKVVHENRHIALYDVDPSKRVYLGFQVSDKPGSEVAGPEEVEQPKKVAVPHGLFIKKKNWYFVATAEK